MAESLEGRCWASNEVQNAFCILEEDHNGPHSFTPAFDIIVELVERIAKARAALAKPVREQGV
jgi:hypothetical protein